jgi:hypothetical protein
MKNFGVVAEEFVSRAKQHKSKYVIDVCDTWDFDHYPVLIEGPKDEYKKPADAIKHFHGKNMQQVYGLRKI